MSDGDHRVEVRRRVPGRPQDVFDSWTQPEHAREWLASGGRVILDPRVDGLFFIEMRYQGRSYPHYGRYLVVEAPARLEFTWMSEGTRGKETVVRVEMEAKGGETEIRLTHSGIPDPDSAASHEGGWTELIEDLARRLGVSRA